MKLLAVLFLISFSWIPRCICIFGGQSSPLRVQKIRYLEPFFQGWLFRTIDPKKNVSLIAIVGSYSTKRSLHYTSHFLYGCVQNGKERKQISKFIDNIQQNYSERENSVLWEHPDYGNILLNSTMCSFNMTFPEWGTLKMKSEFRVPWSKRDSNRNGPEGWLGYTNLLPCHYFVHSMGSHCEYSYVPPKKTLSPFSPLTHLTTQPQPLSGQGLAHIEGNHGSFFPEGWIWSQGIIYDGNSSFCLVAGKFAIGPFTPLNLIMNIRLNDDNYVFRTTDLDRFRYDINGVNGTVAINATSLFGLTKVSVVIAAPTSVSSSVGFGEPIAIPTYSGFSSDPGARETYSAMAAVTLFRWSFKKFAYDKVSSAIFPLSALEFGGSFQNVTVRSH